MSDGVRLAASTPGRDVASASSHASRTVLPLPRGPWRITGVPGGMPLERSARSVRNSAWSCSRPARYGGVAPVPGRNGPRADGDDISAVIAATTARGARGNGRRSALEPLLSAYGADGSAGVFAGPRRTLGPSASPRADRAAPWNAGVLAGLRRTLGPSGGLVSTAPPLGAPASSPARAAPSVPQPVFVPTAPPHGTPASSPAYAASSAPQAVSCRPRRPLERRHPRRPAPHRRSLSQSSCRLRRRAERPWGGPRTMPACGGGR